MATTPESPYISKLSIGGQPYNIKDESAHTKISEIQTSITGGVHYIGETSTAITDGATTATLVAKSEGSLSKTTGFSAGDLVIYASKEFIWTGALWSEFGSTGSLKALAFKDSASGTVNAHKHLIPEEGVITCTMTQGSVSASGNFTPAGRVELYIYEAQGADDSSFRVNGTVTHTVKSTDKALGEATTFTNASSNVTLTGGSTSKLVKTTVPNVTSAGTMFTAEVSEHTLILTAGTAPTLGTAVTVATGDVASDGTGATVATALRTGGTAAAQKITVGTNDKVTAITEMNDPSFTGKYYGAQGTFTGEQGSVSVSGSTSGVGAKVPKHSHDGYTWDASPTVTVS